HRGPATARERSAAEPAAVTFPACAAARAAARQAPRGALQLRRRGDRGRGEAAPGRHSPGRANGRLSARISAVARRRALTTPARGRCNAGQQMAVATSWRERSPASRRYVPFLLADERRGQTLSAREACLAGGP